MSRRAIARCVLSILGVASILASEKSRAQPVGVSLNNGVHVRAPFVSVDVFPHGGVSVRAPFTAVDVGGRPCYVGPPIGVVERSMVQTALPTPQALANFDDASLRRTLQAASIQLHNQLNRFDTAAVWQQYLRLPDEVVEGSIADAIAQHAAIAKLMQRLNEVAADSRYRRIVDIPAFSIMRAGLPELDARLAEAPKAIGDAPEELPPPQRP